MNNHFGIGAGTMYLNPSPDLYDRRVSTHSVLFNSQEQNQFKTITRITSPNIYFCKKIYKHLQCRINAIYDYKTFYVDYTGWIIEPGLFPDRNYYHNISYIKNLQANIGLQYDFLFGKFKVYPVLEYAPNIVSFFQEEYYTLTSNPNQKIIQTEIEKSIQHNVNVLIGSEFTCSKHFSLSYECGLYQNYFALLARLSLNYNF